jgi:4,5:9,10-diseco-3-hydroxy-5,9,17-trioxoandrosta-1(10),2-diene-4-oate hydrolase
MNTRIEAVPAPVVHRAPSPVASSVKTADSEVCVRRSGAGPPVVCLHAVGHDGHDFDALAARLGDRFELVTVDWPGHGDSPPEPAAPSSRRYGAILTDLLEQLDLRDAVLLGNSVGGGAAIVAAAAVPSRLAGLVLCDTSGLVRPNALVRFVCRRQARLFARGEAGDPDFERAYRRYYERTVLIGPRAAARREEIIAAGPQMAPLLRRAWLGFGEREADLRDLAPRIRLPVLFAWARRDRSIPWTFSRAGARRFPNHRVERFDGSHSPFLEAPEAFDAAFLRFTAKLREGSEAKGGH